MNTPNKITISRILLIPIFLVFLMQQSTLSSYIALVIFIIASATDGVDGFIARKNNLVTNFGKFIDPLADKLLVASALITFVGLGYMPAWTVIVIISREFIITSLRLVAVSQGKVIAAGMSGKIKTVVQIVTISVIIICSVSPFNINGFTEQTVIQIVVYVCVIVTVYSGIVYLVRNWSFIDMRNA